LQNKDTLVLAHGTKSAQHAFEANAKSAVEIIELFKQLRRPTESKLHADVWYVGSKAELHGAFTKDMQHYSDSKRPFVPFAHRLYDDETVIYRKIVPAAFQSDMGSGVVSAR
jgi:hypothetical protein